MVCLAISVSTAVAWLKMRSAFVGCATTITAALWACLQPAVSSHGIMIRCPPIVLPIGSALPEPVPVIPNSPIAAELKPDIPYSLLAFHPQFFMSDMPTTSKTLANQCRRAARDAGLNNVRTGNVHLLV